MKTKISRTEYLQLAGLLTLAKRHNAALADILEAAAAITREKNADMGHTSDMVYGNRGLDDGLKCLGITPAASENDPKRSLK